MTTIKKLLGGSLLALGLLAQSLPAAEQRQPIHFADITWESLNISQIRQSYYTLSEQIIGQEVKRNIGRGSAFINSALDAPTLIKRGESVELQSALGGIQVIANGTALGDGRLGQKIRIKNNQSERIVTGTVIASGKVATH